MCRESREDKECLLTKSRKDKKDRKRIVVAATGASGLPILKMCLQIIREDSDYESILILSDSAKITLQQETKDTVEEIEALADQVCDTKDIGIHSGHADNLILRAADVTIKEQRTLVLAARETPLSAIHLRNLSELATIPGVRIIPPMMTFYHQPENIEEMTYHIAAKLVEPFGIEAREYRRWTGLV